MEVSIVRVLRTVKRRDNIRSATTIRGRTHSITLSPNLNRPVLVNVHLNFIKENSQNPNVRRSSFFYDSIKKQENESDDDSRSDCSYQDSL